MTDPGRGAYRAGRAMSEGGPEGKIARARAAAAKAMSLPAATAVIYDGDFAGRVLLHMLKDVAGGRVPVRVICVQPDSMRKEALLFTDKLRRIYSLDMTSVRFPAGSDGTEENARALKKAGAARVITPRTEPFEGGAYVSNSGEFAEYRPLAGFSAQDVQDYMFCLGLPACSLDAGAAGRNEDADDAALREKLKSLGYM